MRKSILSSPNHYVQSNGGRQPNMHPKRPPATNPSTKDAHLTPSDTSPSTVDAHPSKPDLHQQPPIVSGGHPTHHYLPIVGGNHPTSLNTPQSSVATTRPH